MNILNKILFTVLTLFACAFLMGGNAQDDGRTYYTLNQGSVNEIGSGYDSDGLGTPFNEDGTGFYRLEVPVGAITDVTYSDDGLWWELGGLLTIDDPPGADTQVVFNDGGSFATESHFTWQKATHTLHIGNADGMLEFDTNKYLQISGGNMFLRGGIVFLQVSDRTPFKVDYGQNTSAVTFVQNEAGANFDFRIESDNNANMFHVDADVDLIYIRAEATSAAPTINAAAVTNTYEDSDATGSGYCMEMKEVTDTQTSSYYAIWGESTGGWNPEFLWGVNIQSLIANGIVINDAGGNTDTRIEGDTDPNLLVVDASADRVGIGTASPQFPFHVDGTAHGTNLDSEFTAIIGTTMVVNEDGAAGTALRVERQSDADAFIVSEIAGIVCNEGGAATGDFRAETDTESDYFFIDANGGGGGGSLTLDAVEYVLPTTGGAEGTVLTTSDNADPYTLEWGTAGPLYFQYNLAVTAASADTYMLYGTVPTTATVSPAIMRPGSITGVSFVQTADLQPPIVNDVWNIQVYVNGANVWSTQISDGVSENEFFATQASETDAVAAGDNITVFCDYVSGTTDLTECMAVVEVTFHN